jgi:hypothetical protein
MLGLIAIGLVAGYLGLLFLLPKVVPWPRARLLIRLVLLSPLIWVVGNGLVGYAWFQVTCMREGGLTVLERNLPPAKVVRLQGRMAGSASAEGILERVQAIEAVEALNSKYERSTQNRPIYSRYERGPLKTDGWPGRREYERKELPLDIIEVRAFGARIVEDGRSQAQYVLSAEESKRAIRQYITDIRLLRPDGTLLARDVGIVYLWMDSNLVPFGAASQDSSRCNYDSIASKYRLIGLVAS